MSSGRGLGRGALLRALMDSASSSSEEIPKPPSQETVQDSGLGREASGTPPTTIRPPLDLNQSRSSGRGFVSSISSDASQPVGRGAMGRAKLIESLAQLPIRPALTQISSDENSESVFVPRPMGRGAFIAGLKTAMRPEEMEMVQKLESPPRPPLEQKMSQLMVKTPPRDVEMEPVMKHGKAGRAIDVACNYIRLKFDPDTGYFEYEVQFDPPMDSQSLRGKYLGKVLSQLGVAARTFDGQTLYLPVKLPDKVTVCQTTQHDETPLTIRIIFKKQKRMMDGMHLYNVLFNRIMRLLHYVQFNRKMFDPTAPKFIPQYKLEIWPGYVTAVDEYEGGVMLCLDVSHRILRQNTVLETMRDFCRADPANYKENALKALLGEFSKGRNLLRVREREREYSKNQNQIIISNLSLFRLRGTHPLQQSNLSHRRHHFRSQSHVQVQLP
jgi:aubergine